MTIMATSRQGARRVAKSYEQGTERANFIGWAFENTDPTPRDMPPLPRPHLLILPNSSIKWDQAFKYRSLWVAILTQATTDQNDGNIFKDFLYLMLA